MSTVLIIGASRGIGYELAEQYVEEGARVIATARDEAGLAKLRDIGCEALKLDVTNPASVSGLSWQLDGERLDIAWQVAGVICSRANALSPPTQQEFDRVMHANVLGPMQIIPQVAPMVESSKAPGGGRFGFISSEMGHIGSVGSSGAWLYRVSKSALNMAMASARHSYPHATFVSFHPGWVQTAMGGESAPVTVQASAAGLRKVLANATRADSGSFMRYDGTALAGW
ncbi:SDR family oxidoreductase [Ottowia thiooxydans]|uniref:NAD(P)-dependent dehydrogenase (Short-subunit alcohol dehydrogenase family) n=1 Tax=Ottowia thiooxydans TaxID=219182 RepID=A0ABV2QD69_9BURK